jgi:hypothetical protein
MMRLWLILVALSFECVLNINSYQIPDFDLLPQRFQIRSRSQPLNDLLYELSNQNDLYEEEEEDGGDNKQVQLNSEELIDAYNNQNIDDTEIKADLRDEETESHSSLGAGHQYVSGGAGEGKQHLKPSGYVQNKEEVKSDEDLPAYCDPPNPCPIGYKGDDCDLRNFNEYTAEFSKNYQEQQFCMCDDDHNNCQATKSNDQLNDLIKNLKENISPVVAKKSPRIRRDVASVSKLNLRKHHLNGHIVNHVAKKKSTNY